MKTIAIAALLAAACEGPPAGVAGERPIYDDAIPWQSTYAAYLDVVRRDIKPANALATDPETHWYQVQAALLDPRAYVQLYDSGHTLDVTVPSGRTWFVVQMFQVLWGGSATIGTGANPQIWSEDAYPGYDDAGFLRKLHVDQALAMPEGSRVRCNVNKNGSYVYYADPELVIATDPRYDPIDGDPRGLYYSRLARLDTLERRHVVLEWIGGGDNAKTKWLALPTDFDNAMILQASTYDIPWILICGLNTTSERNNQGTMRWAERLLAPFKRLCMPNGSTARVDIIAGTQQGEPYGTNEAFGFDPNFFNKKGTGEIIYAPLPSDW